MASESETHGLENEGFTLPTKYRILSEANPPQIPIGAYSKTIKIKRSVYKY